MNPIKVGIVGLRHGMASVKEVLDNADFELVALCSRTRESYDYLCGAQIGGDIDSVTFTEPRDALIRHCRARRNFREVAFYTDYDAFLDHHNLEAVIVAVPIALNAEYPVRALNKGKHVLASKPFAPTLEAGRALKQTAEQAAAKFMVNYEFRYAPLMQAIRGQIEAGAIGTLRLMWWNMFRMPFRPVYANWAASGGPFMAEVCHWFDLFHMFNAWTPFKKVCAFAGLDVLGDRQEIDDNAVCIIEYANGVRAGINYTYFTDQPQHNLFGVVGDGGKITADTDAAGRYVLYNGAEQNRTEFAPNPSRAHRGHLGFDVAHRRFARVIRDDLDVNRDEAERGFESLLISIAARRAGDEGRVISREDALAG
ncbi:MAG: Gfo/Idh/MocA family oxidoreductase [Lentisphaerae bacterium]|nr:Gfo/Idh/MocA family oxidoreductase [Lentisphaerota bacterium]